MLLTNKLTNATKNDAQSSLFSEIRQTFETTLRRLKNIYLDDEINKYARYIDVTDEFEQLYKLYNIRFRTIFFTETSDKNTSVNLYNKAFNKINYVDVVKKAHPEYELSTVNKYFTKFEYRFDVFWNLYKENLTLLYARHGNQVHFLQIIISYVKVIIENFDINKVNWQEVGDYVNKMMDEFDDIEIRNNVTTYGEKPARQRKSGMKYMSKTKNREFEVKEMLDSGMKKKDIAAKLNISRMTLDRMIKNNPFLQ